MDKDSKADENKERLINDFDKNKPEMNICTEPSDETSPNSCTLPKDESNADTKTGPTDESSTSKPVTVTKPNPGKVSTKENDDFYKGQTMIFRRSSADYQQNTEWKQTLLSLTENQISRTKSYTDLGARPKARLTECNATQNQPMNRKLVNDLKDTGYMSSKHELRKENNNQSKRQTRKKSKKKSFESTEQRQNNEIEIKARQESKENISSQQHLIQEKNKRKEKLDQVESLTRKRKNVTNDLRREYCLYIILRENIKQHKHLKDFLKHRMSNPQYLDFTVKKTETIDAAATKHMIVLQFSSRRKLLEGRYLLNKSNHNWTTKVSCYESENDAKGVCEDHKMDKLKVCEDIVNEAENVILTHDAKLENEQAKLRDVQDRLHAKRGLSLTDFQTLVDQIPALEDKIKELSLQRKEFVNYIQAMKTKITEVIDKDFKTQIRKIRIAFGVECRRLEAALPMYACRDEILTTVKENQVCVVLGETGSGKSTQMVQYLYQAGFAEKSQIICTQPRKIAAISLAQRVALEMGTSVGQEVGYRVGMQSKITALTKVIFATDHILLNECLKDEQLSKYKCVIIDEAHERSIFTDLLLGMLKKCLVTRPELRIVITSATIDPSVFTAYFATLCKCPVLRVSGRVFPVEVVYNDDDYDLPFPEDYFKKALKKAIEVHREKAVDAGDILVFLTSPFETEKCCEEFKQLVRSDDFDCLQLHGRLTPEEQQQVFTHAKIGKRKIVFATNSAETSITIPGIKFVVDTGVAKEMQFDPRKNVNSLSVVPISQSSANQRKGRAGRVSVGHCFRLYSEKDFERMDKTGKPEIQRIHLGQGLLKLMEIGADPLSFDFVEPPEQAALTTAMETLTEILAVENGKITELGRWISKLPIDPRLGALVKRGIDAEVPLETLIIAAYNNQRNIFFRVGSEDEKKTSDMLKVKFCHENGDIFTALNVYKAWSEVKEGVKGQWCKQNSINGKAMKNIREMVKEIMTILQKEGGISIKHEFSVRKDKDDTLLSLIFRNTMQNMCIFLGHEKAGYLTLRRKQRVQVHPSSSLLPLGLQPTWVVYGQLLCTTESFITDITPVPDKLIDQVEGEGLLALDRESFLAQQVQEAVVIPVGRQGFVTFVGRMHIRRRELEEELSRICNGTTIIVDANKIRGEISLFCLPQYTDITKDMLCSNVNSISEGLALQAMEEPLSTDKRVKPYRALIRLGGQVVDILMPTDFRTVSIKVKDFCRRDVTEENMTDILSLYGQIEEVWRPIKKGNNYPYWGKITFVNKNAAETATNAINNDEECDIILHPIVFETEKSKSSEYTLKLRWCRRPARDHCFVYLNYPEDLSKILVAGGIRIDNSYTASVRHAKKDSDLMIRGLRSDVTEESIRYGLLNALGLPEEGNAKRFKKIVIPRLQVSKRFMELTRIRQQINDRVEQIIVDPRVRIDVRDVKDNTVMCCAFLGFVDPAECEQVADALTDDGFSIDNNKVQVDMEFKTSTFVNQRLFRALKRDIDHFIHTWHSNHSSRIKYIELKSGNFSLDISGTSPRKVARAKAEVDALIDGDVFDCGVTKNLDKVFSASGKKEIQRIEKRYGAIISLDERKMKLTVQGITVNREAAVKEINEYLLKVGSAQEISIELKGKSNPPGMMKTLLNKYGIGLKKLAEDNELVSVKLNLREHEVYICGFEESIKKTLDDIQNIKESLLQEGSRVCSEGLPDCPVCFVPVEIQDFRRLEYCGHAYCKICLASQIEHAIKSKEFPVKCARENCGKPLVVRDFSTQIRQGLVKKQEFIDATVSALVSMNNEKYRYCSTADCQMVYAVSSKSTLFSCPLCLKKLCTRCHKSFHEGITCEMNESELKDGNSLLKWLKEKPNSRKLCPKCHIGIEKTEGCNHMTCKCGAHICWVCMEYFSDSRKCYGHLERKHGSFV